MLEKLCLVLEDFTFEMGQKTKLREPENEKKSVHTRPKRCKDLFGNRLRI